MHLQKVVQRINDLLTVRKCWSKLIPKSLNKMLKAWDMLQFFFRAKVFTVMSKTHSGISFWMNNRATVLLHIFSGICRLLCWSVLASRGIPVQYGLGTLSLVSSWWQSKHRKQQLLNRNLERSINLNAENLKESESPVSGTCWFLKDLLLAVRNQEPLRKQAECLTKGQSSLSQRWTNVCTIFCTLGKNLWIFAMVNTEWLQKKVKGPRANKRGAGGTEARYQSLNSKTIWRD